MATLTIILSNIFLLVSLSLIYLLLLIILLYTSYYAFYHSALVSQTILFNQADLDIYNFK